MKRFYSFITAVTLCLSAFAWSQKGHDATAYIAECHFTEATADSVSSLLDGKSPVYWANWLDNASHTPQYYYTKTWHYRNIDTHENYDNAKRNPKGDVISAAREQIAILADSISSRSQKQLALKILIHIVGDMHQPMHMGHATDLGGNRTKIRFFNRDTNLHSVWDSSIAESGHKWSYSEWQEQIDRLPKSAEAAVITGSIDDWAKQTMKAASVVYERTHPGSNLSYNEVAYWTPLIETQLLNGGLRLAHILNGLFDSEYAATHTAPYTPAK